MPINHQVELGTLHQDMGVLLAGIAPYSDVGVLLLVDDALLDVHEFFLDALDAILNRVGGSSALSRNPPAPGKRDWSSAHSEQKPSEAVQ
jgi:hypothetical protein